MRKKLIWRLSLSCLALVAGLGILAVSLSQTSQPAFSASDDLDASHRQVYFDQILPDHVAYPMLMALDRLRLESASDTDQVYLNVEYGQRRFEYTVELLDKDRPGLALTTLTKAMKYQMHAAQLTIDGDMPSSVRQFVSQAIAYQLKQVAAIKGRFSDQDRAIIDQLISEGQAVRQHLEAVPTAQQVPPATNQ